MIIETKRPRKNNTRNAYYVKMQQEKTKKLIILCGAILFFLLIIGLLKITNSGYKPIKVVKNASLVYEVTNIDNKRIPYINIKDKYIGDTNSEIRNIYYDYENNSNVVIDYDYALSGDYLSVVVEVESHEEYAPILEFKSYIIDLKNKKVITDDQVLNLFKTDRNEVEEKIKEKMEFYYQDEKNLGYIEETCDYNCFLEYREIENYLDNICYYIEDGHLKVFKPFTFQSVFVEEEYFNKDSFKIEIK